MNWRLFAACREMRTELFYVERGESTDEAKAACARCPVRNACLADAIEHREMFGIWGGLSERGRRAKRRGPRRKVAA